MNAYPYLDKTLVGRIREAVEQYEDWDPKTCEAAVLAFATFAEVPEEFRIKEIAGLPEEYA